MSRVLDSLLLNLAVEDILNYISKFKINANIIYIHGADLEPREYVGNKIKSNLNIPVIFQNDFKSKDNSLYQIDLDYILSEVKKPKKY